VLSVLSDSIDTFELVFSIVAFWSPSPALVVEPGSGRRARLWSSSPALVVEPGFG